MLQAQVDALTLKAVAAGCGVHPTFLRCVLKGQRPVSPKVAAYLGLERVWATTSNQ